MSCSIAHYDLYDSSGYEGGPSQRCAKQSNSNYITTQTSPQLFKLRSPTMPYLPLVYIHVENNLSTKFSQVLLMTRVVLSLRGTFLNVHSRCRRTGVKNRVRSPNFLQLTPTNGVSLLNRLTLHHRELPQFLRRRPHTHY
ncbi:hypothetical protein L1887_33831 [Cichorium endivia]|nr:hypothetical protein L1887_33831 [Cichorium endivia]